VNLPGSYKKSVETITANFTANKGLVQIFAELIFAFFGPFREIKFREIYKLLLDREN